MFLILNHITFIIIIVSSLISVAFYTVTERKILGYIQLRKGPNKVGFTGILQPFSDAIKLFSKTIMFTESMNFSLSSISPSVALLLSVILWPFIPISIMGVMDSNFSVLSFFVISSISVYIVLTIGWSANSKYCFLGAIRSVAQMISYEVYLFIIVITTAMLSFSYSFSSFSIFQSLSPFMALIFYAFIMWLISCLAETNRAPFDFAEGESELVSGFNVEYMGGWFAMIFLAEYLSMVMLSFISVVLFIGLNLNTMNMFMIVSIAILFLWIRGTLPRFRYDLLMSLSWKIFLPLSIVYLTLILSMNFSAS